MIDVKKTIKVQITCNYTMILDIRGEIYIDTQILASWFIK